MSAFDRIKAIFSGPVRKARGDVVPASHYIKHDDSPSWSTNNRQAAMTEGFDQNLFVHRCIRKRMVATASVPLQAERWNRSQGVWQKEPSSPLQALIAQPNPNHSMSQFLEIATGQMDATGEFMAHIVRGGRGGVVPLELWPVPVDQLEPIHKIEGDPRYITHYRASKGPDIPAEDILHLVYTHPANRMHGASPLLAGGMSIDVDNEAAAMQKVSMQNRGVPDGLFILEGDEIGEAEYEQAREQVRKQYSGRDHFREPWVVAHAKWQQTSLTPVELDMMQTRSMTAKQICAAFGVPHVLVGAGEDPTYSNYETARAVWWQDEIVPFLNMVAAQIGSYLAPGFGGYWRLTPDFTDVPALRENLDEKVATAERMQRLGIPLAVINDRLGLGLDEDSLVDPYASYLPSGMIPVGSGQAIAEDEPAEDDLNGLTGQQLATIRRIINDVAAGDMPGESAVAAILAAAPGLSEDQARAMIDPALSGDDG